MDCADFGRDGPCDVRSKQGGRSLLWSLMPPNTSVLGPAKTLPSRGFRGAVERGDSHQQPLSLAVYQTLPHSSARPTGEAETTQREKSFQWRMRELESCWKSREVAGQSNNTEPTEELRGKGLVRG